MSSLAYFSCGIILTTAREGVRVKGRRICRNAKILAMAAKLLAMEPKIVATAYPHRGNVVGHR